MSLNTDYVRLRSVTRAPRAPRGGKGREFCLERSRKHQSVLRLAQTIDSRCVWALRITPSNCKGRVVDALEPRVTFAARQRHAARFGATTRRVQSRIVKQKMNTFDIDQREEPITAGEERIPLGDHKLDIARRDDFPPENYPVRNARTCFRNFQKFKPCESNIVSRQKDIKAFALFSGRGARGVECGRRPFHASFCFYNETVNAVPRLGVRYVANNIRFPKQGHVNGRAARHLPRDVTRRNCLRGQTRGAGGERGHVRVDRSWITPVVGVKASVMTEETTSLNRTSFAEHIKSSVSDVETTSSLTSAWWAQDLAPLSEINRLREIML
ncbi:hypothetical protein EVAR_89738_1 [Eumeta japonica]|uniref:Uncharacterized protein n=1 Tax=Eumeta variegata TaxID=151549 RepID=A0A4C1Y4Z0_EUMVA|nr:hypothetical protein EVAR_89738_1 [Eumeta japonica]